MESLGKRSEWLQKVPLFSGLTSRQLTSMNRCLEVVTFEDGEVIVQQGSRGDAFYIVASGTVGCTVAGSKRNLILMSSSKSEVRWKYCLLKVDKNEVDCAVAPRRLLWRDGAPQRPATQLHRARDRARKVRPAHARRLYLDDRTAHRDPRVERHQARAAHVRPLCRIHRRRARQHHEHV